MSSKYIYTTIYEEFTGMKPPEPKSNKPRNRCNRRATGHPYKSRAQNNQDNNCFKKKYAHDFPFDYAQQNSHQTENNYLNTEPGLTMAKIKDYHFNNKHNNNNNNENSRRFQYYRNPNSRMNSSTIENKQRRYYNSDDNKYTPQEDYDF